MKLIRNSDIQKLNISGKDCYNWVEEGLKLKGNSVLPPKINMTPKDDSIIFYNVMPSIIPNKNIAGVKVVNRYPRTPSIDSQILLYNFGTGELLAVIDGNFITSMRTGAVCAHSVMLFAKEDFYKIGIIGLGDTAKASLDVLLEVCKKPLNIKLYKYKDHAEKFMERYEKNPNIKWEVTQSYEDTISNSDVVISCVTYTDTLFAKDEYYTEGCLVVPVHTRGFQNCDLFFDKVFCDDVEHIKKFKHFDKFKSLAEVSEVVVGKKTGRQTQNQRILAYNIGISLHDIYFAQKIYNMCGDIAEIPSLKE